MREGPLAALFRKTAQETDPIELEPPAEFEPAVKPRPAVEPPVGVQPEVGVEPGVEPDLLELPVEVEPGSDQTHIPSPQERLRNAFSADIPESLMDRPAPAPARESEPATVPAPERDVYARPKVSGEVFGVAKPVGTPVLRVVGVGGAGVNAVNRMVQAEVEGVEFLAINTDLQSLQQSAAHETLHIGDAITRGLGSGSDPELGRLAAREEHDRIKALLRGADMVFIAAGAGGGTGTGAAPIVAQIARELGALTVGIVTRPFQFEGSRRREQAEAGIDALAEEVDTLIVVPNNRLLSVLDRNVSMVEAFRVADDVLRQGVQGISDLVTLPGLINLDFADVRTIMSDAGNALLGIGMGTGDRRAIDAAEQAVASPLLETSMEGARSILLSITGGRDLSLWEVNESAKTVAEAAHPDANIIFGAMVDDKLDDQVWVTVVATGYGDHRPRRRDGERSGRTAAQDGTEARSSRHEEHWEPRVSRMRQGAPPLPPERRSYTAPAERRSYPSPAERRSTSLPLELDIPEFIPRR